MQEKYPKTQGAPFTGASSGVAHQTMIGLEENGAQKGSFRRQDVIIRECSIKLSGVALRAIGFTLGDTQSTDSAAGQHCVTRSDMIFVKTFTRPQFSGQEFYAENA